MAYLNGNPTESGSIVAQVNEQIVLEIWGGLYLLEFHQDGGAPRIELSAAAQPVTVYNVDQSAAEPKNYSLAIYNFDRPGGAAASCRYPDAGLQDQIRIAAVPIGQPATYRVVHYAADFLIPAVI